jgi:threonine 3-dehydrogenase
VMQRLHMHEGFDIGLEMSGAPKAFDQMVERMIMGGKIAMLGIPSGPTTVDWNRVIFKALTIKGIYGREMFETWYKMIAMLQSGLDVRKVITHRMKAADYAKGFALMKQGSCGKVVLDWG